MRSRAAIIVHLLSSVAAGGCAADASAQAQEPPAKKKSALGVMAVNLPLLVSDRFAGDVTVEIDTDTNEVRLKREDAERILKDRVDEQTRIKLFGASAAQDFLSFNEMKAAGIEVVYDPSALEIRVTFPTSAALPGVISIFGDPRATPKEEIIASAGLSGSVIFSIDQPVNYGSGGTFGPLNGSAEISLALGGNKGIFAFSDLVFDGQNGNRLRRGRTSIIHDDQPNAIRYLLGDLLPQVEGFQGAPSLGGIGVQRSYQDLQPNRNIRPAGLFRFAIEQPSLVEIAVNGAPVRTIRLERGQYDIRDFNFVTGLNAVEIFARDEFGRRSIARFDQFFDFGLLDKGINEFGFYFGAQQSLNAAGNFTYELSRPIATGYFRAGLSSTITAGLNAQSENGRFMIGSSVVAATPIGSVALLGAVSRDRELGTGGRYLASYQHSIESIGFIERPSWNLEAGYTSARFTPVGDLGLRNDIKFDLRARAGGAIGPNFNLGISASYATRRNNLRDTSLFNITASRRVGPLNVSVTAEHARSIDGRKDNRALISLGMQLGPRGNGRATFDTRGNVAQLDVSRFRSDVLGDWGARAAVTRDRRSTTGVAEASYNQNRALFSVQHSAAGTQSLGNVRHRTSLNVATQVSFADNRIGFGRPVGHNFVLAYPHKTLKSNVEIAQGVEIEKVQARSGTLGPALGVAGTAYAERRLTLRAPDAPAGYDIGPGYYTVVPLPAGGYLLQVGSDAFYSVSGTFVDALGKPVELLAGSIRSIDRPEAKAVPFFTNKAGRFIAVGLVPGRHRVEMGRGSIAAEIEVAQKADGTIDLGIVKAGKMSGQ